MAGPGESRWQPQKAEVVVTSALSHADREQAIGALKAAFVQGQLTEDDLDARAGQVYASRTYAELAEVTASDIPLSPRAPSPRATRGGRQR